MEASNSAVFDISMKERGGNIAFYLGDEDGGYLTSESALGRLWGDQRDIEHWLESDNFEDETWGTIIARRECLRRILESSGISVNQDLSLEWVEFIKHPMYVTFPIIEGVKFMVVELIEADEKTGIFQPPREEKLPVSRRFVVYKGRVVGKEGQAPEDIIGEHREFEQGPQDRDWEALFAEDAVQVVCPEVPIPQKTTT